MRRLFGLLAAIAVALSGCGGTPGAAVPSPTPSPSTAWPTMSVSNETTIPIVIAVNGTVLETVPAGTREDPIKADLPARPWTVEARSPSGRVLDTMTVSAADYIDTTVGKSARADLACGRIDIWSGAQQPLGPAVSPDASKPCD